MSLKSNELPAYEVESHLAKFYKPLIVGVDRGVTVHRCSEDQAEVPLNMFAFGVRSGVCPICKTIYWSRRE